jgi:S1-C subfamily serine protease
MILTLLCIGCINVYPDPEMDPIVLADYNVILHKSADGGPICGATIINPNTIITAAHCVINPYDYYIEPSDRKLYPVDIIAIDYFTTTDLAVLETRVNISQPTATVSSNEPRYGEDIWVIGCGGGECDALSKGIVSKLNVTGHHNTIMNQFDVTAWYGNSGGGVFDDTGRLVGVVSQFGPQFDRSWYSSEPETGWMYGCTVKAINNILGN